MKIVFFYGTLKRGFYNYERFGMDKCEFLGTAEVRGYKMYSNGIYPAIINSEDDNDIIFGEIFKIDDKLFNALNRMETGAGYHIDAVEAVWSGGGQINVELFAMNAVDVNRWKLIESGNFK